jgi:hypothetical protein
MFSEQQSIMTSQKIIKYDPHVFFDMALVKGRSKPDLKVVRLVINSNERNKVLFTNPNSYEINLVDDIPYVTFVKLIASVFPFSSYTITTTNNLIHYTMANTAMVASIPIGDYTDGDDLASAVQAALQASVNGTQMFNVMYVSRTDNFVIQCTRSFTLNFKGEAFVSQFNNNPDFRYPVHSAGAVLGFGISSYASAPIGGGGVYQNAIQSPFRMNLKFFDDIIVNIELMNLNKSTSDSVNESFLVLSKNGENVTHYDSHHVAKYFYPPVAKLNKIKVTITDMNGNLYDFQNQDHRMELMVETNIKNPS